MSRILWLASYPKSGNTWLRIMLANLGRSEPVDINALNSHGGIAGARARFDNTFLFAAGLLTHDECDRLRPALYRHLGAGEIPPDEVDDANADGLRALAAIHPIKTHDAWTCNDLGEPILGGKSAAFGAVLIVRDPRDVVASLANHNGQTLDEAIAFMARPDAAFARSTGRQPQQLRQQLLDWSGFNRSWLDQGEVPVHLLRYEDMLRDPAGALAGVLDFAGIRLPGAAIALAARLSAFESLRDQEAVAGFREKPRRAGPRRFFRQGRAGGWRGELSDAQRRQVELDHGAMMVRLGYQPVAENHAR